MSFNSSPKDSGCTSIDAMPMVERIWTSNSEKPAHSYSRTKPKLPLLHVVAYSRASGAMI